MTNEDLENLFSAFPSGRVRASGIVNGEIGKVSFYNCIGNVPSLDPLFKKLYEAGVTEMIKAMEFYCDGDDYKNAVQIDPQEAVDLLVRYGPFKKLEQLNVDGEDYIALHAIRDFSALQDAAPALQRLELQSARGVGLQGKLQLNALRHLVLGDMAFDQLGNLGECDFPAMEVLEISFSEQDGQVKLPKEPLNTFCEGRFSNKLEKLFLAACDLGDEQEKQLIDYFIEVFPDSPLLKRLVFLDLMDFHFSAKQLERLSRRKEKFAHLGKFYLGGDFETWPKIKKEVGDFVTTPRMVREHELVDLNNFPVDAGEVRSQIGGIVNRIKTKDAPELDSLQFVTGVVARQSGENKTRSTVVVIDRTTFEIIETAQAEQEDEMEVPVELAFYRQLPSILAALEKLKTPVQMLLCEGAVEKTPYEFSLANYLGVKLDIPAIACADDIAFGQFELPKDEACEATAVMSGGRDSNHNIAFCLRTQKGEEPVFVSQGHKISNRTACDLVLELSPDHMGHRLPEPLRVACETAGKGM